MIGQSRINGNNDGGTDFSKGMFGDNFKLGGGRAYAFEGALARTVNAGWIMNFRSGTTRLLAAAASAAAGIGCAGTYDLEPDLQASVGVYVGELNAASWARRTLISDDGTTRTMQYGFDEGCRFVLEMDSRSYVVRSWRYADAESARSCRKLRMQRAV